MGTIVSIARVAVQKTEDVISKACVESGKPDLIMSEGEVNWAADMLWLVEKGTVEVLENGESLGKLREGDVFGGSVAFGHLERQPLTIKLVRPKESDSTNATAKVDKLVCWCIPVTHMRYTLRQFPEASLLLEERLMEQIIGLLSRRMDKLLFFQHCNCSFLDRVRTKMKLSFHPAGKDIIKGADEAMSLKLIMSGSVRLGPIVKPAKLSRKSIIRTSSVRSVQNSWASRFKEEVEVAAPSWSSRKRASTVSVASAHDDIGAGSARADRNKSKRGSALILPEADPNSWASRFRLGSDEESPTHRSASSPSRPRASIEEAKGPKDDDDDDDDSDDDDDDDDDENENAASDDDDDDSTSSSSSSSSCSADGDFLPPKCMERAQIKVLVANPEALAFGEGVLLGFQHLRGRPVTAAQDCIVLELHNEDFMDVVEEYPKERARFEQMEKVKYQEWKRADIARLASVDLFSKCSDAFLAVVINNAVMQLFFEGDDIIADGLLPKGLLLLMSGNAVQTSDKGLDTDFEGPATFGTLEWLGVISGTPQGRLKAKEVCLVFVIAREHLLDALKDFPHESTAMVQQVLRHNGIRMSISSGLDHLTSSPGALTGKSESVVGGPMLRHRNVRQNIWHLPFCRGLDSGFISQFTVNLKVCKLVPGQVVFSPAPHNDHDHHHHHHVTEDPDFLVVLKTGSVQVDETPPNKTHQVQTWKQVAAPLVAVGFNRKHRAMVLTSTVCEVHRMSTDACARLAELYPKELKIVLERMVIFTQRREEKQCSSWWCPSKSLRHQAWFRDSDEMFMEELTKLLRTELYLPGEALVLVGDPADSTLLLECGTAAVLNDDTGSVDRGLDIHDGFWIGEMAMFGGDSKHKSTIEARTVCRIQRLYTKDLVHLLSQYPAEQQRFRELAEMRLRAAEKEQLDDHAFFHDFDRVFLNLLRQKCKAQVFFEGEVLMRQGDIADSLVILGQDSCVTLHADGCEPKKLMGRACLGTTALLSPKTIKRASTVITQTVCSVRKLSREDWLDALKLHPDQQKWLATFTRDQMSKVGDARTGFAKKRAWEKILKREMLATYIHRERQANPELYVMQRRNPRSGRPGSMGKDSMPAVPGAKKSGGDAVAGKTAQAIPETWECFNGTQVLVPHTRLPQLAHSHHIKALSPVSGLNGSPVSRRVSHTIDDQEDWVFTDCEDALLPKKK